MAGHPTIVVTGTVGYTAQPRSHVIGARTLIRHLWRERRGAVKAGTPLDDMLPFGIPTPSQTSGT